MHPRLIASRFNSYLKSVGFFTKEPLIVDGETHHVHLETHYNPKSKRGWYRLYPDGRGEFGIDRQRKRFWNFDPVKQDIIGTRRLMEQPAFIRIRRMRNGWK